MLVKSGLPEDMSTAWCFQLQGADIDGFDAAASVFTRTQAGYQGFERLGYYHLMQL